MPETYPQQPIRPRDWKRTAATALLLLVGGAIVNVAVAWGCALWIESREMVQEEITIGESGEELPHLVRAFFEASPSDVPLVIVDTRFRRGSLNARLIHYLRLDLEHGESDDGRFAKRLILSSGWPLGSMTGAETILRDDNTYFQPATVLREGALAGLVEHQDTLEFIRGPDGGRRLLPLQPIWPGFIIDTIVYAVFLWLLFMTPFHARRRLRRRRALCEKCAYPIGVSPVCTECGAAVRLRSEGAQECSHG